MRSYNARVNEVLIKINRGEQIHSREFKLMCLGSGTKTFFKMLAAPENVVEAKDPLRNRSYYLKPHTYTYSLNTLIPEGPCSSDAANARYMIFNFRMGKETREDCINPGPLMKADMMDYCRRTETDFTKVSFHHEARVANIWFGSRFGRFGEAAIRSKKGGGPCLITFNVATLLSSEFGNEMKRITSLAQKLADLKSVFLVGVIDDQLIQLDANFTYPSFKRFIHQEIKNALPPRLRKKLVRNIFNEDRKSIHEFRTFFYAAPSFPDSLTGHATFWASAGTTFPQTSVNSGWYICLTAIKAQGSHIDLKEAQKLALKLGIQDLEEMLKHFEISGEIIILPGESDDEALIVSRKNWLKKRMEMLCHNMTIRNENLWEDGRLELHKLWSYESKAVRKFLKKCAHENNLLFEIGPRKVSYLPYVVPANGYPSGKAIPSPILFSIHIPRHYTDVEFFHLFCGNLLKRALFVDLNSEEQGFERGSDFLEFLFENIDTKAWAHLDRMTSKILLGLPPNSFSNLKKFIDVSRIALKSTIAVFNPTLGNKDLFDLDVEIPESLQQFPHLLLHFVRPNGDIFKVVYEALESNGTPLEFGGPEVDAETIADIDFTELATDLFKASQDVPEKEVDVTLVCSEENLRTELLVNLLQYRGFEVKVCHFPAPHFAAAKSKVLLTVLTKESMNEIPNRRNNGERTKMFQGWPVKKCLVTTANEDLASDCKQLFGTFIGIHDKENMDVLLRDFLLRIEKAVYPYRYEESLGF